MKSDSASKLDYGLLQLQQIAVQAYEVVLLAEEQAGCAYTIHGDELDELRRLCEATEPKPYRVVTEEGWMEQQATIAALRRNLSERGTTVKSIEEDVARSCSDEELRQAFDEILTWHQTGLLPDGVFKTKYVLIAEKTAYTNTSITESAFLFEMARRHYNPEDRL